MLPRAPDVLFYGGIIVKDKLEGWRMEIFVAYFKDTFRKAPWQRERQVRLLTGSNIEHIPYMILYSEIRQNFVLKRVYYPICFFLCGLSWVPAVLYQIPIPIMDLKNQNWKKYEYIGMLAIIIECTYFNTIIFNPWMAL
jgi:hypothetical protein